MIIFCLRQPKPVSILLASLIMLSTHLSVTKANNDVENASNEALTKKQADIITAELWDLHCKEIELTRQPEMESRKLKLDNVECPFGIKFTETSPRQDIACIFHCMAVEECQKR